MVNGQYTMVKRMGGRRWGEGIFFSYSLLTIEPDNPTITMQLRTSCSQGEWVTRYNSKLYHCFRNFIYAILYFKSFVFCLVFAVLSFFLGPKGSSESQMYLIPVALKSVSFLINVQSFF
jgi:hypothetical protein